MKEEIVTKEQLLIGNPISEQSLPRRMHQICHIVFIVVLHTSLKIQEKGHFAPLFLERIESNLLLHGTRCFPSKI